MSGTVARPGAGRVREAAVPPRLGRLPAWVTPVNVVITVAAVVALGLRVYYQYRRPGFLLGVNEYDDGPYFGSAVRLVNGSMPYRDFVLVQPPGITLLMSPVALLTKVIGTAWGLVIGRLLTVAASTAGVVLAGRLVRHRGLLAVLVTCGIMAVYPDAVAAAHTVLVEPWLVLFCLIGALALFDGDRLTTATRRLAWGGVAFGFAGAVEAWAIVPVVVIFVLLLAGLPRLRRAAVFTGGVAAGFLIPVLPFVLAGPRQFYLSLYVAQVGSRAHTSRVGLDTRFKNMLGLTGPPAPSHTALMIALATVVIFIVGSHLLALSTSGWRIPALDWFAPVTAGLVALMFLWPPQFHYHFAAFLAPFLALSIALPLARITVSAQPLADRWLGLPLARFGAVVAGLVLVLMGAVQGSWESSVPGVIGPIPAAIDRIVPPGACLLTDQASVALLANRFVSNVPGCSQVVDGLGSDLAFSSGLMPDTGAGRVPAVAALWHNAFDHAQYVLLTFVSGRRIAWTPSLRAYLRTNFVRVFRSPRGKLTLYARGGTGVR